MSSTDSPGQLHVPGYDSDSFTMDGTQITAKAKRNTSRTAQEPTVTHSMPNQEKKFVSCTFMYNMCPHKIAKMQHTIKLKHR